MKNNDYIKLEIWKETFIISYNFYSKNEIVKIILDIENEFLEAPNTFPIKLNNDTNKKWNEAINSESVASKLNSFYQRVPTVLLHELQNVLPNKIGLNFIEFQNIEHPMNNNIGLTTELNSSIHFDYIFLNQFQAKTFTLAAKKFIYILLDCLKKKEELKVLTKDSQIFEEFFMINEQKSRYFGFIDNHNAEIAQAIFEMETSTLLKTFQLFDELFNLEKNVKAK